MKEDMSIHESPVQIVYLAQPLIFPLSSYQVPPSPSHIPPSTSHGIPQSMETKLFDAIGRLHHKFDQMSSKLQRYLGRSCMSDNIFLWLSIGWRLLSLYKRMYGTQKNKKYSTITPGYEEEIRSSAPSPVTTHIHFHQRGLSLLPLLGWGVCDLGQGLHVRQDIHQELLRFISNL